MKTKKNTFVEKNEPESDSLTTYAEEDDPEDVNFLPESLTNQIPDMTGIDFSTFHSLAGATDILGKGAVSTEKTYTANNGSVSKRSQDIKSLCEMPNTSFSKYSRFFLSSESPTDCTDSMSVSCSSTYNANCNYNTTRKTIPDSSCKSDSGLKIDFKSDLNIEGEVRGRMRRWSSVDCDTVASQRPPFPHTKKIKASSANASAVKVGLTCAVLYILVVSC